MYLKINYKDLLKGFQTPCDLFIKKSDNEFHLYLQEDSFIPDDFVQNVISFGPQNIYIKKKEQEKFYSFKAQTLVQEIKEINLNVESPLKLLGHAFQYTYSFSQEINLSTETFKVFETVNKGIMNIIKDKKDGLLILKKSWDNSTYLFEHSFRLSLICCAILRKLGRTSQKDFQKLSLASIFHDSAFNSKTEVLSKIHYVSEIENLNASAEEKVNNHPFVGHLNYLNSNLEIKGVDKIILNHHEQPDGSGFPNGTNGADLPLLSCVFILAEEIIHFIDKPSFTKELLVHRLNNHYSIGKFKNVSKAALSSFSSLL